MTIATVEARNEPQTTSLASQARQARQTKLMMMMMQAVWGEGREGEVQRILCQLLRCLCLMKSDIFVDIVN